MYLKYSFPLIPYSALVWVNHAGDRYLITHMIGLKEAGIYFVAYAVASLAFFLRATMASYTLHYLTTRKSTPSTAVIASTLI